MIKKVMVLLVIFVMVALSFTRGDSHRAEGDGDDLVTFSEPGAYVEEALSAYESKPADVEAVESKSGRKAHKNNKGYWEIDHGDGIVMVYIPAGEFTMGSNDGNKDEKPPHKVYLDGYWMGKTEVTVKQFRLFVKAKNYVTQAETDGGAGGLLYGRVKNGNLKRTQTGRIRVLNIMIIIRWCVSVGMMRTLSVNGYRRKQGSNLNYQQKRSGRWRPVELMGKYIHGGIVLLQEKK